MAGTVAQNQVGAFTSPSPGDAEDANVVKSNDNTTRAAFNTHDADSTVHIQSSVLAARPSASTANRVWFTSDGLRLYYDTGSAWNEAAYLPLAGGTLTGGVTGTTLSLSSTLAVVGALSLGATPALTGTVRIPNGAGLNWRNAANTGDIAGIYTDNGNVVHVGNGSAGVSLDMNAVVTGTLAVGTTPALTGAVRIPNGSGLNWRNKDNNGDIPGIFADNANAIHIGSGAAAVNLDANTALTGTLSVSSTFAHTGTTAGFFGTTPGSKPSLFGSRSGACSLAVGLLSALAGLGLITDGTTP